MPPKEIPSIVSSLKNGDRKILAKVITMVENEMEGSNLLLKEIQPQEIPVIGVTGPPGAGKSTLINALLNVFLAENKKCAVVAVDPTSPFNFGSLLADRIRMSEHFNNENVFIRSVASRGSLGGLSEKIIEITDVLRSAGFDFIIIETVGVGQSEVEIAGLADTTIVVVVPESGDEVQVMKSGIMEIADIFVVNKSDREGAGHLNSYLKKMLIHKHNSGWAVPVISTIASQASGIDELYKSILDHRKSGQFNEKKLFLATEKVYRLIRNQRMKGLKREDIKNELEKAMNKPDYNMYRFAEKLDSVLIK